MDENDMADILQQPSDVPQETENEHKIVFEEANEAEDLQEEEEEEILSSEAEDDDYEPGNDEDISLEADDDDGEEEDDQGKLKTGRVRVYRQQVGNTSKQERKKRNTTVQSQRRLSGWLWHTTTPS
jgi:hypothetical protein